MRKSGKGKQGRASANDRYIMYGTHAVKAALANPDRQIDTFYHTERPDNALLNQAKERGVATKALSAQAFADLVGQVSAHQQVALRVKRLQQPTLEDINLATRLVMLDQLTDSQNIGAIVRTSAAFSVDAVLQHKQQAPEENAGIAKAAVGTLEAMPLVSVTNLAQTLKLFQKDGFWVVGLDGDGTVPLPALEKMHKWVLVLGSEGKGIRDNVKKQCDFVASIPIAPEVESLNASNAAAIALYQLATKT